MQKKPKGGKKRKRPAPLEWKKVFAEEVVATLSSLLFSTDKENKIWESVKVTRAFTNETTNKCQWYESNDFVFRKKGRNKIEVDIVWDDGYFNTFTHIDTKYYNYALDNSGTDATCSEGDWFFSIKGNKFDGIVNQLSV